MLNLLVTPTHANMRLIKTSPKKEGGGISWDCELSMEVPDEESAELVDTYLPGALRVYRSKDGNRGDVKTSGGFDLMRGTFSDTEGNILSRGHCEIKAVHCKAHSQQAVLVVKLRIHGLLTEAAMRVVENLDEIISVSLDDGALKESQPKKKTSGVNYEGMLVVHNNGYELVAGIVTKQTGNMLLIDTMEDNEADIPVAMVESDDVKITALSVRTPEGHQLAEIVQAYRSECASLGCTASWVDVVTALGQLHASNQLEPGPDFSWELSPIVWQASLALAAEPVN